MPNPMPFIVGVPRSGTTLLRLMLDAHPDLAIPSETGFIPALLKARGDGGLTAEGFVATLASFPTWEDFDLRPEDLRAAVAALRPFETGEALRAFYRLYAARFGKPRYGDKTPNYALIIDRIESLLPEARFVHVIRDGRDVALSVRGLWFSPGQDMESLARDWRDRIRKTRDLGRRCRHYLEVRFESLILESGPTLRRICGFLDLPYDARLERYHETAPERLQEFKDRRRADGSVVITKEERLQNQALSARPPEPAEIGRFKRDMSPAERARFESVAGGLLKDLGYETEFTGGLGGYLRRRRALRSSRSAGEAPSNRL